MSKAEDLASAARLRGEVRDLEVTNAAMREAHRRGIVDPEAAAALLDRSILIFDDDDRPRNLLEAMDALVEKRPYLLTGPGPRPSKKTDPRFEHAVAEAQRTDGVIRFRPRRTGLVR